MDETASEKPSRLPAPQGPLDLGAYLDRKAVFGREGRLEVEIGAGAGGFAIGQATAHPELDLVAIEVRKKLARYIEDRRKRRGLGNLLVIEGDGRVLLPRLFAPRSVDAIHVQFPDPWWKRRHHDRRLVDDGFSVLLYNLLRPGGLMEVRTDVKQRGIEMGELPQPDAAADVEGEAETRLGRLAFHRRNRLQEGEQVGELARSRDAPQRHTFACEFRVVCFDVAGASPAVNLRGAH